MLSKSSYCGYAESTDWSRNFGTYFDTCVTLVDSSHRKIGEGILGIIVKTHHLGHVVDNGVVSCHFDIHSIVEVLVAGLRREGLDIGKSLKQGVACPCGDE